MENEEEKRIQFVPFTSSISTPFWDRFTKLKLNELQLNTDPINVSGSYSRRIISGVPPLLQLDYESLSKQEFCQDGRSQSISKDMVVSGSLINTNTIEDFKKEDKAELLRCKAAHIWEAILSGEAESNPSHLGTFLAFVFADLKKYHYYYWFAFPVFNHPKNSQLIFGPIYLEKYFTDGLKVQALLDSIQNSSIDLCCFTVCSSPQGSISVLPLSLYVQTVEKSSENGSEVFLGFSDPCSSSEHPGWPLRNLLTLAAVKWSHLKEHLVICLREEVHQGKISIDKSLVLKVKLNPEEFTETMPTALGWEKNERAKLGPKFVNLKNNMDSEKIAESAVDLNLSLMRWRLVPKLDLDAIRNCKCLLIGAGTLGCNVARCLLGWGIRKVSFVDCGTVSYSNPVRQSLYNFEDCLNEGKPKAECAAQALKKIFPQVDSRGYNMTIPMPGHPVSPAHRDQVAQDVREIEELVKTHDAIFLLTDSRESRWLLSLMGAAHKKIVITAALGFDSFLVVRHGVHSDDGSTTLGCYYCNDVVAPGNSVSDRTLDQQCTVTRPGMSFMAAGHVVELLVGILQHPLKGRAPSDLPSDEASSLEDDNFLGLLPHSIRYYLGRLHQLTTSAVAFNSCSACGPAVKAAYFSEGFEFLLQVFNSTQLLEEVSGLLKLHQESANNELWELSDDESFGSLE